MVGTTGADRARNSPTPNTAILRFTDFLSFVLDTSYSSPDHPLQHIEFLPAWTPRKEAYSKRVLSSAQGGSAIAEELLATHTS